MQARTGFRPPRTVSSWRLAAPWLCATLAALVALALTQSGRASQADGGAPGALTAEELAESPGTPVPATGAAEPLDLTWDDLLPAGELERLQALYEQAMQSRFDDVAEGSAEDTMVQIGTFNTVSALDASRVRIPGFVVPLDFALPDPGKPAKLARFLLVPYFGACIHTPPPPPNQIVYVEADPPAVLRRLWDPVTVEGVLRTTRRDTDTADAAYTLTLERLAPYEY